MQCRRDCRTDSMRSGELASRLPQRVPRRITAGLREVRGNRRRVYLEVYAQFVRFQRAGQHAHHLPDRLAQLEDPRVSAARESAELPWTQRADRDVQCGSPLLPTPGGGTGGNGWTGWLGV